MLAAFAVTYLARNVESSFVSGGSVVLMLVAGGWAFKGMATPQERAALPAEWDIAGDVERPVPAGLSVKRIALGLLVAFACMALIVIAGSVHWMLAAGIGLAALLGVVALAAGMLSGK